MGGGIIRLYYFPDGRTILPGELFQQVDQPGIQVGDGRPDVPFGLIPLPDIIGDRPELQKRNILLQAYIMKTSAFHAFNNGGCILLNPFDPGSIGTDLIYGDGTYGLQAGQSQ